MQEYVSKVPELNILIEKMYIVPSECEHEEMCALLDGIYLTSEGDLDAEFRHEYANISGKMRELNNEEKDGVKVFSLDNLVHNITDIYDYAVQQNKPYIKNLFKLKDHISLEAGRIAAVEELKWKIAHSEESVMTKLEYTKELASSFDEQVRKSKNLLDDLQAMASKNSEQIVEAESTLVTLASTSKKMKEKMESVQKESITILGIFASIVLSFTAGMVFSSSVLENVDKASPYRIVGVVLLIGMVITNLVTLLLVYMDRVRMLEPGKMEFPKSIRIMNVLYIGGFLADFAAWLVLEKLSCFR